jgi:hypothetical protein
MTDQPGKQLRANAKAAAESIGKSTALIRRYALDYEEVFGKLPRSAGGGRFYDEVFCQSVMKALEIRQRGLCTGLVEAFQLIRDDAVPEVVPLPSLVRTDHTVFQEIISGQQELISRLDKLEERLELSQTPRLEAPTGKWGWWKKPQNILLLLLLAVFGGIGVLAFLL